MKTTAAFPEPNYTQTPNDFFEMVPDMSEAELRVTLVMIRQTFGFHRDGFKMGMGKLADAAGLSRPGAMAGAEAAEKRGTFRRVNPDVQTEAEWELVLDVKPVDTSTQFTPDVKPVDTPPQLGLGQVGVKERIKKEKYRDPLWDALHGKTPSLSEEDKQNIEASAQVEEIVTKLEQGLRLNFPRGTKDQSVYRRLLNTGKPIERFIEWVKAEERRLAFAFLYAKDTSALWRDFPQAFGTVAAETDRNGAFYG